MLSMSKLNSSVFLLLIFVLNNSIIILCLSLAVSSISTILLITYFIIKIKSVFKIEIK